MPRDLETDFFEEYINFSQNPQQQQQAKAKREPSGVSIPKLLLISMPRMAIQMAWAAQWAALGPYLGTMMPRYAVQLTQFVGPMTGLLIAPTVGVLSDRCTSRWGRRRPFFIVGGIMSCICWILMGYTKQIGEFFGDYGTGKPGEDSSRFYTGLFTIIFYTWMDLTVNITQTPVLLLVADFAGDRQTTGCAMGEAWSLIGTLMVSGYIEVFGAAHLTLRWFLGMLAAFMFVTMIVACMVVKEVPLKEQEVYGESSWQRIRVAFESIYQGLVTLPHTLLIYALMMFFSQFGYTSYTGNKGQFFGVEVLGGNPAGAADCGNNCTDSQDAYNRGVRVAGGSADFVFNAVGYIYLWLLPYIVAKIGAKNLMTLALIPQCFFVVMAFCNIISVDVAIVILCTFTQCTMFALIVPIIIHVFGPRAEIGMYVGAVNSANCLGQLLTFIVGAALVETEMGYRLPILIGGCATVLCLLICLFLFRIKIYSL